MRKNISHPYYECSIVTKFAIKYGDNLYMTHTLFTFSEKNWFTDKIDEIPNNMLFDSYNDAHDCLSFINEHHSLIGKYLSIDVVRKLKENVE